MEDKYIITKEQLEFISHYARMFKLNADLIMELCSSEKPDINYGFELGKIHSHLRECFTEMLDLENQIYKSKKSRKINK